MWELSETYKWTKKKDDENLVVYVLRRDMKSRREDSLRNGKQSSPRVHKEYTAKTSQGLMLYKTYRAELGAHSRYEDSKFNPIEGRPRWTGRTRA